MWAFPWPDDRVRDRSSLREKHFIDIDLRVSALLNQEMGDRNLAMLNDLFFTHDVMLILKMEVSIGTKDFKVWKYNKSGAYNIKLG